MTIGITGAAGDVGSVVRDAFDEGERELFTHSEYDDLDSTALEVTDESAFVSALDGVDVLVHLAWAPAEEESWTDGHGENLEGVYNAFEAARQNDVDRVVFASSNHAVGMYNREDTSSMESVVADPSTAVAPADPPRPDSYYGVAKVAAEAMGAFYADRYEMDVVSLRIGWLMSEAELRETESEEADARHRFARAMWLSHRDCRAVFDAAVHAPLDDSPLVVNAISRNSDRFLTLTDTMVALGYKPRDDAAEVLNDL